MRDELWRRVNVLRALNPVLADVRTLSQYLHLYIISPKPVFRNHLVLARTIHVQRYFLVHYIKFFTLITYLLPFDIVGHFPFLKHSKRKIDYFLQDTQR